jgi:hypothetical protein
MLEDLLGSQSLNNLALLGYVKRGVFSMSKKKVSVPVQKPAVKAAPLHTEVKVTVSKKIMGRAPEEYSFVLHDGRKLKTAYELIDELETMSEESFRNYVNDMKNDFANWMRDVFQEKHLADEMIKIRSRVDTQRAILKHLVREFKKLEEEQKKK